ncbi:monoglyceride lipase [Neolamprologus brichardi]|uniref:monoglyceride lipase n=1 Tax=Neolamprologus brichardi TaxID=32507 RepID=UPI001643D62B|nr:monoglyceride lipase [Neolamprologus brichardi]
MNAVTAASCLLVAGFSFYLYGSDVLSSLLRVSVTDSSMPEPGAAPRRSPQGVPYSDLPHIVNADGLHLFCRYWEPTGQPRALVFIAHGAGEHCGPYDEMAQRLKELSLLVFAHDHVGHGQSEGDRMTIKDFQIYIRDSLQHIDLMKSRHPDLPVFIVGHSMGSVGMNVSVKFETKASPPWLLLFLSCQVEAYDADELNYHGGMRVSFAMQLMAAVERMQREVPSISWPFLLLHGDADKLCDIRGSRMMYDNSQSTDKKIKIYEGGYHALHHDLPEVAESVLKELTSWITEHIPAATSQEAQGS